MINVVFDLDGTLFNTFNIHIACVKEVVKCMCDKKISTLQLINQNTSTLNSQLVALCGKEKYREAKYCYRKCFCRLIDQGIIYDTVDVRKVLYQFKGQNNIEYNLFTGRDSFTTKVILKYFDIESIFSSIVCCDKMYEAKLSQKNLNTAFPETARNVYITDDLREYKNVKKSGVETYIANWFASVKYNDIQTLKQIDDLVLLMEKLAYEQFI